MAIADDAKPAHEPSLRLDSVKVRWSEPARWRRRMGWTALVSLPLLSFLSGVPHTRSPLPREVFAPSDLIRGWWQVLFWGALATFATSAIAWRILRSRSGPTPKLQARIEVDARELRVTAKGDRTRHVDLADIDHVFEDAAKEAVMVRLRGGEVLAVEGDEPQRRRLASALVPDASAHAARLPIGSSAATHSTTHTLLVTFFVVIYVTLLVALVMLGDALFTGLWSTALPRLAFALASAAPLALLWPMLRSRRVVVGADGVRIDGLVRRRYYPLDSIRGMTARPDGGVSLDLQTGRTVEIPGRPDGGGLASRIADAMRARGEARDRGEVEVHGLARDGRKVTRWRDELKRLAADASYRAEAVRVADLETVLTNPIADPEQRVAAAVALSQDDGARKRIRIAAEASADPDLKAALEAAAEGELATSRIRKARKRHSGG